MFLAHPIETASLTRLNPNFCQPLILLSHLYFFYYFSCSTKCFRSIWKKEINNIIKAHCPFIITNNNNISPVRSKPRLCLSYWFPTHAVPLKLQHYGCDYNPFSLCLKAKPGQFCFSSSWCPFCWRLPAWAVRLISPSEESTTENTSHNMQA